MFNDILERLFPWTARPSSREEVKQRLKVVLAYDRAGISPGILEEMQKDIVAAISRYVELDDDQLQFSIENSDRATALIANFPIRRIKSVKSVSEEKSAPMVSLPVDVEEKILEEDLEPISELEELFVEDSPPTPESEFPSELAVEKSIPSTDSTDSTDIAERSTTPEPKPQSPPTEKVRKSSKSE